MTDEQLKACADEYFSSADIGEWRISEAALKTGISRERIIRAAEDDENYEAVRYIKLKLECAYEMRLNKRGNSGDVFALRCLGWNDEESEKGSKENGARESISELLGEKF